MNDDRRDRVPRIESLIALGRDAEAARLARELLGEDPEDGRLHCLLACALLDGSPKEALAAAERAVALDPDEEWGHRLRAHALVALKRARPALAAAREAVRLAPELPETHAVLSMAAVEAGRINEAWAAADRVIALAPDSALGYVAKSNVSLQSRKWKDAEQWSRRALERDPENSAALNNLGVALQAQNRHAEAMELFGASSRVDPTDPTARENAERSAKTLAGSGLSFFGIWLVTRVVVSGGREIGPLAAVGYGLLVYAAYSVVRYWRGAGERRKLASSMAALVAQERRQMVLRSTIATVAGVVVLAVALVP